MATPNLDCMPDAKTLWDFYLQLEHATPKQALALFGCKFAGYTIAARNLAHYAANKATAMQCRSRGDIHIALQYESICDRIYNALPRAARW